MIFRQLFDKESSTYTYLIGDRKSGEALLIDPVLEQLERDTQLLTELGLRLKLAVDTHVHADHVSSLGALREKTGCKTAFSVNGGAGCIDLPLKEGDTLLVGETQISVIETPGHTNGCLTYRMADRIFTGDALLIRGCGRTDFQQGNAELLYDSVTRKLFSLPDETKVYPAHDYRGFTESSIGEEKRFNPRLTKTREEFVVFMKNLKLPDPKMMAVAVPMNLGCGKI